MFELTPWDTLIYTLLILALMFFISKLFMGSPPAVRIRDNKNGHRWSYTDFVINFPLHCNAEGTALCVRCPTGGGGAALLGAPLSSFGVSTIPISSMVFLVSVIIL